VAEGASQPTLLVFADDWGRHPSSCQHLVRQLLDRYEVHWVNTIGMRTPRLDWATLRRGLEKVGGWLRRSATPHGEAAPVHVANPRMWPWFRTAFDRRLNRLLLGRQLGALIRSLPEPPVVLTTLPIVADLVGVLPVRRWVYYCVDDFGQWPGLDHVPLRQMEELLVRRADVLIAVSDNLRDRLSKLGGNAHLLTHGVDLDFWQLPRDSETPLPALANLERPLVVFWGLLDPRMDVSLLQRLGEEMTAGTIVLVGPELDPDPALAACRRVVRLGSLPFEHLPQLAQQAAVLIMPYADLPATRAMQPLKLKEYLATGKPTVACDLPAVRSWADCLDIVDSPEAFAQAVRMRLAEGLPKQQRLARARLADESWSAKARLLERWALGVESSPNGDSRG
jgi:glycosyltransferase involved in cell wall biosynthesis